MVTLSRLQAYGVVSTGVFVSTVVNAFRQRSNFYAAAVYLSKSNACKMILWNQAIYQTVLFGKLLQTIFLGELRLIEVERLQERGWFAVTETLLALTIFKDEFESTFVLLFVSLLFLKTFHWLASDRIEALEQSASVSRLAHARMIGLLSLLWVADAGMLIFAADCILVEGPTVMIMFASEYMILAASVWASTMKYIINCIDLRREVPWEEKSIYIFYVELIADFFKLVTYLTFFGLTLTFYGLPLNILRDVYLTLRSFLLRIRDLRRYRQATRNMDTLYPNATREEMEQMADKTCIICREDMEFQVGGTDTTGAAQAGPTGGEAPAGGGGGGGGGAAVTVTPRAGPNETPKKLPCGHVFHFHCLRSWLERQQSCPTCRRPVLPQEQPRAAPAPTPAAAARTPRGVEDAARDPNAQAQVVNQAHINLARNLGREAFAVIFPGVPFPPEAALPAGAQPPPTVDGATPDATLAPPAIPPREQVPNVALPPVAGSEGSSGELPPPVASTSGSTTASSSTSPTSRPSRSLLTPSHAPTSTGDVNPLSRFTLPNLELPPTGEAGLYRSPPSFANIDVNLRSFARTSTSSASNRQDGFSDIAYGAYPQFKGRGSGPPVPLGSDGKRERNQNLEEKIQEARERMSKMQEKQSEDEKGKGKAQADEKDLANEAVEEKESGTTETTGTQEKEVEATDPKRAMREAAERRLRAESSQSLASLDRHHPDWQRKTDTLAPWIPLTTPLPPSRTPSPSPSPSRAEPVDPSSTTTSDSRIPPRTSESLLGLPRLIPLFDQSDANSSLLHPLAPPLPPLSSQPSRGRATLEELVEADQLVRRQVEDRLRQLLGFQDRLEGLIDEMRTVLSAPVRPVEEGLPPNKVEPASTGDERVMDGSKEDVVEE